MDLEQTISEIATKSGKSEKEIKAMVEEKVKKFSGLMTEQGAVFIVEKELGLRKDSGVEIKIKDLEEGMKGIDIGGKVKAVFPAKEFDKNGKKGQLKSFILGDDTGEVRITLWNEQVEKYSLGVGNDAKIRNAMVSAYNDKKQVTLGFSGEMEVTGTTQEVFGKLSELRGGMNNVCVIGRLLRKFPCKEFDSKDRKGKLCSFQFGDETALMRVTAWNDKAEEVMAFNEGDAVEIKNAYTKESPYGIELHLGYSAELNNTEKKVPSTIEILKEGIKEKAINSLLPNENVLIKGKISEIQNGKLFYLVCEKCGKKVSFENNGIVCEKCGEVKGEKRAVVSVIVEDDSASIRANFFGKDALKIMNYEKTVFEKELDEKSIEKILTELNEKQKGKAVSLLGYEKANSFSGDNEFAVKEIL